MYMQPYHMLIINLGNMKRTFATLGDELLPIVYKYQNLYPILMCIT